MEIFSQIFNMHTKASKILQHCVDKKKGGGGGGGGGGGKDETKKKKKFL